MDGGAQARKLGWVERAGNVAIVEAVVLVGMLVGSESAMVGRSARRRVHVDVSSEVVGEPFL